MTVLLSGAQFLEETKKEKGKKGGGTKEEKLLNINAKITEHDLEPKIKHILKWLEKEYSVRIVISGDAGNQSPAVSLPTTSPYSTRTGTVPTETE